MNLRARLHRTEFGLTGLDEGVGLKGCKLSELVRDPVDDALSKLAMGARARDGAVNDAELVEARRGERKSLCGVGGAIGGLPENGRAALGAYHGIGCIVEHEHAVGHGECESASRAPFPHDNAYDGRLELGHDDEVRGDGFALSALFGADSAVRPCSVDEAEDGPPEALGLLHEALSLTVPLGVGGAEVARDALLGRSPALGADDGEHLVANPCDAAHDGGVIAEVPVSVELDESVEAELDKLEGGGVFHRAGCLHDIVCARSFIAATPALAARLLEERVRLMSLGQNMRSIGCGNASGVEREELGEGCGDVLALDDKVEKAVLEQEF